MDNLAAVLIFISNLLLAIATFVSAIQKQKTKYKIKYFIGYIYPDTKENVYAVSIINESLNIPIKIDFVGIRLSRNKF